MTIYLPVEFEGRFDIGEQSVGSAFTLLEALEELREELDVDAEDDEEDEEDGFGEESSLEMVEQQLNYAWHAFAKAATACANRRLPLHIIS